VALLVDNTNNTAWSEPWNHYKLVNLKTKAEIDIPLLGSAAFSKGGNLIIGVEKTTDGNGEYVTIDVTTGRRTLICDAAASAISNFQELANSTTYITSWDETKQILNIYKQSNGRCAFQNSIPLSTPVLNQTSITPDGKSAVVWVTIKKGAVSHDQLFYLPLNGTTPIEIDSPVFIGAKIWEFHVLPDSKSIFYTGTQFLSGQTRAFVWKAP
jgi:hypothetical protein